MFFTKLFNIIYHSFDSFLIKPDAVFNAVLNEFNIDKCYAEAKESNSAIVVKA